MTVNTILTFVLVVAAMTVGFVLTAPEIAVVPLVLVVGVVGVGAPLLLFPLSYLLWLAFDLSVSPPDADELAAAAVAVDLPEGNA